METPPIERNAADRPHLPALDGVRGLAILAVILFHAGTLPMGWVGVDIFFALSGFLITGILLHAKRRPGYFRNFYARRTLRIFPLYYLYLLAVIVVLPRWTQQPVRDAWSYWLYASNWVHGFAALRDPSSWDRVAPHVQHLWSLAIEEQFYLVWPLVVSVASVAALRRICITGVLAGLGLRILLQILQTPPVVSYLLTPTRMDPLFIGAWLATLSPTSMASRGGSIRNALIPVVTTLAFFALGHVDANTDRGVATIGYTLFGAAGGGLIFLAIQERWARRFFSNVVLRIAGRYSYAAYLFHPIVIVVLHRHGVPPGWPLVSAVFVTTFVLAFVSWKLFESPILSLKRYFTPTLSTGRDRGATAVETASVDRSA